MTYSLVLRATLSILWCSMPFIALSNDTPDTTKRASITQEFAKMLEDSSLLTILMANAALRYTHDHNCPEDISSFAAAIDQEAIKHGLLPANGTLTSREMHFKTMFTIIKRLPPAVLKQLIETHLDTATQKQLKLEAQERMLSYAATALLGVGAFSLMLGNVTAG